MVRCLWGLLMVILPALAATDASRPNDNAFAPYHAAIDAQISAILNRPPAMQPPAGDSSPPNVADPSAGEASDAAIRGFANQYWRGRVDSVRRALDRLGPLRPVLEGILESEGVPKSMVAVVLVESAGDPLALSPKQARGLWQIIPDTARLYGLTVEPRQDDRIHTEKATRAAARFLHDLYAEFRDWPLALAAYNSGRQTVERALQRSRGADFWKMSSKRLLPDETRNYVPAVLAAMQLFGGSSPAAEQSSVPGASRPDWVYAGTAPGN